LEGDDGVAGHHNAAGYEASAVMLDLAITLANADGKISGREVQFLNRQVDAWAHVGDSAQRRLRARLRLGIVYPPSLASLRSKIEPLPAEAKVGLGKLLSALALADGTLAPAAVKHLEKVYGLLGIEASALYRELHGALLQAGWWNALLRSLSRACRRLCRASMYPNAHRHSADFNSTPHGLQHCRWKVSA
jgi:uncharacterized tellurite resistance protein B-like protein